MEQELALELYVKPPLQVASDPLLPTSLQTRPDTLAQISDLVMLLFFTLFMSVASATRVRSSLHSLTMHSDVLSKTKMPYSAAK